MTRTIALATFATVAALATLYFGTALANVGVSVVRVEGSLSAAEGEQVRYAVAEELATPGLPTATDVAAAVHALGWTREVRVRLHWPDTLHVVVARETLAARWGEDDWLTTSGKIVPAANANARRAADLPMFHTTHADAARAMQVFNLLNESAADAGLQVVRLEESVGGDWSVLFANEIEVVLGATDLSERFERFIAVYRALLRDRAPLHDTRGRLSSVDARYDTGVAVRWAEEYAAALPSSRTSIKPTIFLGSHRG